MGDGNGEIPGEGGARVVMGSVLPLVPPACLESVSIVATLARAPAARTFG